MMFAEQQFLFVKKTIRTMLARSLHNEPFNYMYHNNIIFLVNTDLSMYNSLYSDVMLSQLHFQFMYR